MPREPELPPTDGDQREPEARHDDDQPHGANPDRQGLPEPVWHLRSATSLQNNDNNRDIVSCIHSINSCVGCID